MELPLITIITPSYNRADYIREAIESVLAQNYPRLEHIIVDGASTDGTVAILKEYADLYPHIRWISEPDRGLYDAINKGLDLAQGEIIGHLNTDDFYDHACFYMVAATFAQHPEADAVCGGAAVFTGSDPHHDPAIVRYNHPLMKGLRPEDITRGMPLTNSRFYRRAIYDRVGGFDLRYPVAADRQWLFRAWMAGMITAVMPDIVYFYRAHEGSLTFNPEQAFNPLKDNEYLRICRDFWASGTLTRAGEAACQDWHTWEVGYMAWQSLKQGYGRRALEMIGQGLSRDALWPWRFLQQLGRRRSLILKEEG